MEGCSYETSCAHAMELHKILSPCRPENHIRRASQNALLSPFLLQTDEFVMECSVCAYRTLNGRSMAEHLVKCKDAQARLKPRTGKTKEPTLKKENKCFESKNAQVYAQQEKLEMTLFGLARMSNIKVKIERDLMEILRTFLERDFKES